MQVINFLLSVHNLKKKTLIWDRREYNLTSQLDSLSSRQIFVSTRAHFLVYQVRACSQTTRFVYCFSLLKPNNTQCIPFTDSQVGFGSWG